jgi:hypothetical protein
MHADSVDDHSGHRPASNSINDRHAEPLRDLHCSTESESKVARLRRYTGRTSKF